MKESIIIKNFGPLKEVEIDDIKPLISDPYAVNINLVVIKPAIIVTTCNNAVVTEFNINFFERPIFYLAFIPNIPII